jgi:peroxiredoxin Q/BCP
LSSFHKDYARFGHLDTEILAINPAPLSKHQDYEAKYGFPFPLLADESKSICKDYGVIIPIVGWVTRTVMLIDKQGVLRYIKPGMPSDHTLLKEIEKF